MVEIAGEEFNHIYKKNIDIDKIDAGDSIGDVVASTIELYSKSLAITNDMKRVPMIRNIDVVNNLYNMITAACTAVVTSFIIEVECFNGEHGIGEFLNWENEDMIFHKSWTVSLNSSTLANVTAALNNIDGGMIPKESSILGKHKLTFLSRIRAVGGTTNDLVVPGDFMALVEVDWKEITKKQLHEYVLEAFFADEN